MRLRGAEMSRLETFVDAAFAFALTLLVISFDEVPASYGELAEALRGIPAFAASFAIIVVFWIAHRNWSQRYGLDDGLSTLFSLTLVFVIMVYVYPLRSMMAATMSSLTGGWAPSTFRLEDQEQVRNLFTIYGLGFATAASCIVLLNLRALSCADALNLNRIERYLTRTEIAAWSIVGGFGVFSAMLARLVPDRLVGLAGWSYALLAFVMPVFSVMAGRRSARYRQPGPSPDPAADSGADGE
jgi:uncharacterized membrane protein